MNKLFITVFKAIIDSGFKFYFSSKVFFTSCLYIFKVTQVTLEDQHDIYHL